MTFKKSVLIALLSFGIANAALAESDDVKFDRAYQEKDATVAFPLYKELAEKGMREAQFNIAGMYYRGQGIAQNYKQAAHWYQKAAEQGDADAQLQLGVMYYNGQGVSKDYKQAIHWYQKAADWGNTDAKYNLGMMYYNGQGVRKDMKKAKQYFEQTCHKYYKDACKYWSLLNQQGY